MQEPAKGTRLARFGAFEVNLVAGELRKHGVRLKIQERPVQMRLRNKHPLPFSRALESVAHLSLLTCPDSGVLDSSTVLYTLTRR